MYPIFIISLTSKKFTKKLTFLDLFGDLRAQGSTRCASENPSPFVAKNAIELFSGQNGQVQIIKIVISVFDCKVYSFFHF